VLLCLSPSLFPPLSADVLLTRYGGTEVGLSLVLGEIEEKKW
jgi:hypothetical protein